MTDPSAEVSRTALTVAEALVIAGCLYEVYSLVTRRVPPITRLVKAVGRLNAGPMPAGRLAVWAWCGYIAWHFLEPDD